MVPSLPVMPWTMTWLSAFRKIDMGHIPFSGTSQLGGLLGGLIHGGHQRDQGMIGLGQDAPTFVNVVAVEPDHQWLVGLVAQYLQRLHDAGSYRVAGGDTAEDVDEHALDLLVTQDHVQPGGYYHGGRSPANVEEVGRLHSAVLLPRIRSHVK